MPASTKTSASRTGSRSILGGKYMLRKQLIIVFLAVPLALAQSETYRKLWHDPEVTDRIDAGIEANRKGWVTLQFAGQNGKPLSNVKVTVEQTGHEFLFGANIFILGGFKTQKQNRRYEQVFTKLFNFATVPFYWKTLEPEPGHPCFASDSKPIYRRPPPDTVVDFCRKHGITMKGHPLVWDNRQWNYPDWMPNDRWEVERLINRHIEQIARRYRGTIPFWDVVNEALGRKLSVLMPKDYVFRSFRMADRVFPPTSTLLINEASHIWFNFYGESSPYYLLIQSLLSRGAPVDAIGIQCHFFGVGRYRGVLDGKLMAPLDMFRVLDLYAEFGLPLQISEITIPTIPNDRAGEQAQAEVARNLYRLWFSHPAVDAITWWNVADGTATPDEDKWRGGLVRGDLSPKASFKVLDELINHEWRTRAELSSGAGSTVKFKGFYGSYDAVIEHAGRKARVKFRLGKNGLREITLRAPEGGS